MQPEKRAVSHSPGWYIWSPEVQSHYLWFKKSPQNFSKSYNNSTASLWCHDRGFHKALLAVRAHSKQTQFKHLLTEARPAHPHSPFKATRPIDLPLKKCLRHSRVSSVISAQKRSWKLWGCVWGCVWMKHRSVSCDAVETCSQSH